VKPTIQPVSTLKLRLLVTLFAKVLSVQKLVRLLQFFCMMKPSPQRNRDLILENSIPTDTPLAAQERTLLADKSFPEIRLGQWEGFVQDKGRQRNFSLLLFWLINAVMKRFAC
jgi:hypothetical protein